MRVTEGVTCLAAELHGRYIGELIRFEWQFSGSRVAAQVMGELRQISHVSDAVHVNLAGHLGDGTDLTEFTLEPDQPITFMEVQR